jgi:hypothetical protein
MALDALELLQHLDWISEDSSNEKIHIYGLSMGYLLFAFIHE